MGSKELGARSSAFCRWNRRVSKADNGFVLVIHGGATRLTREGMTLEKQVSYRSALDQALKAGYEVLKDGGEAMDAVVAAISVLEGRFGLHAGMFLAHVYPLDCPLFNAGKGAVFNARGKVWRAIYTCYVYILNTRPRMNWRRPLCCPSPPRLIQPSL